MQTCLVRLVKRLVARRHFVLSFALKLSQHIWPGLVDFSFAFKLANYISQFEDVLEVTRYSNSLSIDLSIDELAVNSEISLQ